MSRLRALSCTVPEHEVSTEELGVVLAEHVRPRVRRRVLDALHSARVRTRFSALPLDRLARLGGIGERSALQRRHAAALALDAVARLADRGVLEARKISKLIFVSATGHATPSIDTEIVRRFGLPTSCRRITAADRGCAGGVAALATAAEMVRGSGEVALVVSAEVPSLQLPLAEPSLDEVVAAMHFGDGAAAAIVGGEGDGPEILATASELLPEVGEGGIVITHESGLRLSATGDLPALVRRRVAPLLHAVLDPHGLDARSLAFVAAHPRGERVLDAFADGLSLTSERLAGSWWVYERFGNMISASIFAVLAENARRRAWDAPRGAAVAMAFGAGVTCETALLGWQSAADLERIGDGAA